VTISRPTRAPGFAFPVVVRRGSATHRGAQVGALLGLALLVFFMGTADGFRVGQFDTVLIYAIAVCGINLVSGYGGMLSIGHSALFGVGAYTTGILIVRAHLQPIATLPIALAVGFAVGLLMGLPAMRVRGLYLTLVTLAFAVSFPEVIARFPGLTGGQLGLIINTQDLRPPAWSQLARSQATQWVYAVSLVLLVVTVLALHNLVRSRLGLAIKALRDSELGSVGCGVDPHRTRIFVFGISGAVTGLAGGLFAMYLGALSIENSFGLTLGIQLITGLIIGGAATSGGPIVAGFAIVFIPYYVSEATNGQAYGVVFGVILAIVVFLLPGGVVGFAGTLWRKTFVVVDSEREAKSIDDGSTQLDESDESSGLRPEPDSVQSR
jgi:branched-chain amino acid transport system permease protein